MPSRSIDAVGTGTLDLVKKSRRRVQQLAATADLMVMVLVSDTPFGAVALSLRDILRDDDLHHPPPYRGRVALRRAQHVVEDQLGLDPDAALFIAAMVLARAACGENASGPLLVRATILAALADTRASSAPC